jgi:uncharacterized protein (TIGR02246 family)
MKIALVLAVLSLSASVNSREDIRAMVGRINREYTRAYNAGQLDKILDFFAEDAITLSPDQPPVRGREALRRYYQEGFKREINRDLVLVSIRVETSGDLLYDAGRWENSLPMPEGGTKKFSGYYLSVYKKIQGQWKIVANTFNLLQGAIAPIQPAAKNK